MTRIGIIDGKGYRRSDGGYHMTTSPGHTIEDADERDALESFSHVESEEDDSRTSDLYGHR